MIIAEHIVNRIWIVLAVSFWVIMIVGIGRRFLRDCFQKEKIVEAIVADLYETQYTAVRNRLGQRFVTDYVVTFYAGTKTLKFLVSPWLYGSLHKGDRGKLTYNGNRLIEFRLTQDNRLK